MIHAVDFTVEERLSGCGFDEGAVGDREEAPGAPVSGAGDGD